MNKNITFLILAVLVLGGGYWYFSRGRSTVPETATPSASTAIPSPRPTPSTANTASTTPPSVTAQPTPVVSGDIAKQLPTIDDTWKTYTNAALHFVFQWPTRGRYAPTWDVAFADKDCAGSTDGEPSTKTTLDVGGQSFCHVSTNEGAAGSYYVTDTFTTKKGSRYVVITLTKKLTSAGAMNCKFVNEYPYSTSASTCIPFDPAIYSAHLDQIVSTFKNTD